AVLKTAERKLRGFESLLLRKLDNRIVVTQVVWSGRGACASRPTTRYFWQTAFWPDGRMPYGDRASPGAPRQGFPRVTQSAARRGRLGQRRPSESRSAERGSARSPWTMERWPS